MFCFSRDFYRIADFALAAHRDAPNGFDILFILRPGFFSETAPLLLSFRHVDQEIALPKPLPEEMPNEQATQAQCLVVFDECGHTPC
jgi:hypothetical protein